MFEKLRSDDPYVFYKLMHVRRAEKCALLAEDFKLYEALRNGPLSVRQVCEKTGLQNRPAAVLLAATACMGILGTKDGLYYIPDALKDHVLEGGIARRPPMIPAPGEDKYFDSLKFSFTSNQPAPDAIPHWIQYPQGAPSVTAFDPGRDGWRMVWGRHLADAFDFSAYRTVADLGGATGGVLSGLTGRYPNLRGILVELPYSREAAEACIKAAGAADRVSFFTADFFADPYPDADVIFMSHVLHDWDDEHCLALLRRCYKALPPGHPVIAQEFLLNEEKTGSYLAVFQWVGLVNWTMGNQRTAAEISTLMAEAGFRRMETRPIDTEQSIVIGWRD